MVTQFITEEAIFKIAAGIPTEETRNDYLRQVCGDDTALLNRVQMLLEAHDESPRFLESAPPGVAATVAIPAPKQEPGSEIGPYKIREPLAEGGMGMVYFAEQLEPIRRKVALKIIKPGMATQEVIARFEAERQALAMMDHANIARVLDAGTTDSGLPFFVMEMVYGIPITEYCDDYRLTIRQRIQLCVEVCNAVQHAHQKGIIHRDLKPSNILVAEIDGRAVPKVIDFGVAKALGQNLTEETIYTHFSQVVGTPLYMSPEQAGLGVADIDTRSDVYSLGVLLYELLTGQTPFDSQAMNKVSFDEMRRIIRDEEPLRPSARVSTLRAKRMSTVAERRSSDHRKYPVSLCGELDWIVMQAMDKDRERRYQSTGDLADDLQRFVNGEPVEACPPSKTYRLRKLARRHRTVLVTTSVLLVTLLTGLCGTAWQAIRATKAEHLANERLLALDKQRKRTEDNLSLALQSLDEVYLQSIGENKLLREGLDSGKASGGERGLTDLERDLLRRGLSFYDSFAEQNRDNPEALFETAKAFYRVALLQTGLEENEQARQAYGESIERLTQLTKAYPKRADYFLELGKAYYGQGQLSRWWPSVTNTFVEAKKAVTRAIELDHENAEAYEVRSRTSQRLTQYADALADLEAAVKLDAENASLQYRLARLLNMVQAPKLRDERRALKHAQAAAKLAPANAFYRREVAWLHIQLGNKDLGKAEYEKAAELANLDQHRYATLAAMHLFLGNHRRAVDNATLSLELNSENVVMLQHRASAYEKLSEYEKALADIERLKQLLPNAVYAYQLCADVYVKQQRYQEALEELDQALQLAPSRSWCYKRRGLANFQLDNFESALADIEKAIELNPEDESNIGWIPPQQVAACPDNTFRQGMLQLADTAVEQNDSPVVRRSRAKLLLAFGRREQAEAELAKLVDKDPSDYYSRFSLALAVLGEGRYDDYRNHCKEMIDQFADSQSVDELRLTAWTCVLADAALPSYDRAIRLAQRAVANAPDDGACRQTLGAVLFRAGRYAQALEQLERAANSDEPETSSVAYGWYFLAMSHHAVGNLEEARRWLEKASKHTDERLADKDSHKSVAWYRRLTLELLRHEAKQRIGSSPADVDLGDPSRASSVGANKNRNPN